MNKSYYFRLVFIQSILSALTNEDQRWRSQTQLSLMASSFPATWQSIACEIFFLRRQFRRRYDDKTKVSIPYHQENDVNDMNDKLAQLVRTTMI